MQPAPSDRRLIRPEQMRLRQIQRQPGTVADADFQMPRPLQGERPRPGVQMHPSYAAVSEISRRSAVPPFNLLP